MLDYLKMEISVIDHVPLEPMLILNLKIKVFYIALHAHKTVANVTAKVVQYVRQIIIC